MRLMDIKAARVKKLEAQLREIAYGTKSYRLDMSKFEYEGEREMDGECVELERGQNLLQFSISQVFFSYHSEEVLDQYCKVIGSISCNWL